MQLVRTGMSLQNQAVAVEGRSRRRDEDRREREPRWLRAFFSFTGYCNKLTIVPSAIDQALWFLAEHMAGWDKAYICQFPFYLGMTRWLPPSFWDSHQLATVISSCEETVFWSWLPWWPFLITITSLVIGEMQIKTTEPFFYPLNWQEFRSHTAKYK